MVFQKNPLAPDQQCTPFCEGEVTVEEEYCHTDTLTPDSERTTNLTERNNDF